MSFNPVASSKRSSDQPAMLPRQRAEVEEPQGRLRVDAFEVVVLAEQSRVAAAHGGLGIALPARDGAEAVQPPRDRGDEPPLALHIRGDRPEQGRRRLVRAVGAAQPLDCLVGAPARLQQVMDTALGVAG